MPCLHACHAALLTYRHCTEYTIGTLRMCVRQRANNGLVWRAFTSGARGDKGGDGGGDGGGSAMVMRMRGGGG